MAIKHRLELFTDRNLAFSIYFRDKSTKVIRSLTGCRVDFVIKSTYSSVTALLSASTDVAIGNITLTDHVDGTTITEDAIINVNIPASDSSTIESGMAKYDLVITYVDGTVETVMYGDIAIIRNIYDLPAGD